ncbi:MAG: hypothetical protein WDM91_19585 [Rhizomicrobium sp.]
MADGTKKATSRRALLGAATAALAALPAQAQGAGTRIVVELGGVELPRAIADALERDIRRAVLMAVTKARPHTKFRSLPLPHGTRGIVLQMAEM